MRLFRNKCKECLGLALTLCMLAVAPAVHAEEVQRFLCDGNIHLSGTVDGTKAGADVTVIVTKDSANWLDETSWQAGMSDAVVYIDTVTAGDNGAYALDIILDEMGTYQVVAGEKTYKIRYINDEANANAIATVNAAASGAEVYALLQSAEILQALDLDDEIFTRLQTDTAAAGGTTALEKLSDIIYESNQSEMIAEPALFNAAIYKACVAVMLNGGTSYAAGSIDDYIDYLQLSGIQLEKYYSKSHATQITARLKADKITSVDDFNDKLFEAILLCNIRYNDNISTVKSMLIEFADKLGIDSGKVTDALVRSMVGKDYTMQEVARYVNSYTVTSNGNGNTGSISGSGGGSYRGTGGSGAFPSEITADVIPVQDAQELKIFDDIDSVPWAEDAITGLALKGIISGRTESTFCPEKTITREEFIKLIVMVLSLSVIGEEPSFTDVSEKDWFYPYVKTAYNAEIINGISKELFGAGQNITRQDMAVMTARALQISGVELAAAAAETDYADEADIADYALEAIHALQKAEIMKGNENGAFLPLDNATRTEAAVLIYGIYGQLN